MAQKTRYEHRTYKITSHYLKYTTDLAKIIRRDKIVVSKCSYRHRTKIESGKPVVRDALANHDA